MTYRTRLQDERDEGRAEGREEGRLEKAQETVLRLHKKGMGVNDIAEAVDVALGIVRQWIDAGMAVVK